MALPFFNAYRGSIGRFFQGDPTLVGYWQLGGNSLDNSGNGNNGTDTAVSYSPAYSRFSGGQGAYFNGSSSYISVANSPSLEITGALTLSAWVYLPSIPSSTSYSIINKSADNISNWEYEFRVVSGGALGFLSANTSNYFNITTTNLLTTAGVWYHVAVTRSSSASNATIAFYVNGVAYSGTIVSNNPSYVGTSTLTVNIGAATNAPTKQWFNGYIDEPAIFSRALSPAEISQYYQWATSFKKQSWYAPLTAILLSLSEAVTNTDTFLKGLYRSFIEVVTNTDTFSGIKVLFALFTEAVQSTDTLIKTIGKNLSEAVQNTDSLIKGIYKNFTESITNSDTLNTLKFVMLNLFESVKSTTSLWINGMFIDTWWTKRIKPVINWIKRNKPQ
jgi:hypothetical protein